MKKIKWCFLSLVCMGLVFQACDKSDISPHIGDSSPHINVFSQENDKDILTRGVALEEGKWENEVSGKGVYKIQRKGEKTYLIIANLAKGAKVGMVLDTPTEEGTENAKFKRKELSEWNKYGEFFALANSVYFNTDAYPTPLAFPLKQGGIMHSKGNGGTIDDRKREKAVLNIYSDYAEIISIGKNPMDYTAMNNAEKSYAGFLANDGKASTYGNNSTSDVGRVLVGIRDNDDTPDGKCEQVLLLVCQSKTLKDAYKLLKDELKCSKIINFDGGGSTGIYFKGKKKFDGRRKVPAAIVIKEAS